MKSLERLNRLRAAAKDSQTWRDVRPKPPVKYGRGVLGCWTNEPWREYRPGAGGSWRWIEDDGLLRFAGYVESTGGAYERLELSETRGRSGWYTDNWQSDTTTGAVFQLAGKDGEPRFVAGVCDPWNNGHFCVDFGEVFIGEDGEREAMRDAWQSAEYFAEFLREDDAKQTAEQRTEDIAAELAELRAAVRESIRDYRAMLKATPGIILPGVYKALCFSLKAKLSERAELIAERERIEDDYWTAVPQ